MKLSRWNVGLSVLLYAVSLVSVSPAAAKTTYITKTCSFTLGDNDTKNEAREVSFLRCKRKVLEKAGSYIQQQIQVTDGRLTKEQVSVYAAAILSVEVVKEKFSFKGSSMVLEQTVKAGVDLEQVRSRLAAIAGDKSVAKKVEKQDKQLKTLEARVEELRDALGVAKTSRAKEIRKEQNVVIGEIDRLSKLKIKIMSNVRKRRASRKQKQNDVLKYVERDWLPEEVSRLLGEPEETNEFYGIKKFRYTNVWIIFSEQKPTRVLCIIDNSYGTSTPHYSRNAKSYCRPNNSFRILK